MNPDMFITAVFVGTAVLVTLVGLALIVPPTRRDEAYMARRESQRPRRETRKAGRDAAVH
jgi:hypothetical protein